MDVKKRKQAVASASLDAQWLQTAQSQGKHKLRTYGICVLEVGMRLSLWPQPKDIFHTGAESRLRVVIGKGKVFSSKAYTLYEQSTSCTGKDRPATTKGCNTKCWLLWDLAGSIVRHWYGIPTTIHSVLSYLMKSWQLRKKNNLEFSTVTKTLRSLQG